MDYRIEKDSMVGGPEVIALGVPLFSRCVSFVFLCGRVQHIATLRRFTPSP